MSRIGHIFVATRIYKSLSHQRIEVEKIRGFFDLLSEDKRTQDASRCATDLENEAIEGKDVGGPTNGRRWKCDGE